MSSFIFIPAKKGYEMDITKPLNDLIASYYSSSDQSVDLSEAIEQLNRLRNTCVSKTIDLKHESTLETYQKYYDCLLSLEAKCPPSELQIPFKWKDAFEKSSSFIMTNNLTLNNLQYEKVCILFNMAAIASQIGATLGSESVSSDGSLKQMAKYFQMSSGIFQGLKHLTISLGQQLFTYDFQKEVLNVLYLVMLAQAQESFYHKAAKDQMKPGLLAKVCYQCAEFYSEASQNVFSLRVTIERDWSPVLAMKTMAFGGLAEYYQSMLSDETKQFGEEIARLQKAIEHMNEANCKGSSTFEVMIREHLAKARRKLEEVRKDNDFIYHVVVPDHKNLETIGKAAIAKPTPIPDRFVPSMPDPFANLLPLSVQQAVHKLDVRKQDLVNGEIAALREHSQLLSGVLASLNLPASLEDVAGDRHLPKSLIEKANTVKEKGGLQALETKINELPTALQRNTEILDETERLIYSEEESDKRLREKFGQKWSRSKSEDLNGYWKEQVQKFRKIIENATNADSTVKQKFVTHRDNIALLSASENEINKQLPNASRSGSEFADSQPANRLRRLMDEVNQLKQEQEELESQLKTATFDDMKQKFLGALASDGKINEQALSVEALGEIYGPLQKRVRDLKQRQDELLEQIRSTNDEFVAIKFGSGGEDHREKFLTDLATAYGVYIEISHNLEEGTNFYADLTKLLVNLQTKVNDFCFARKAERDELVKDLQDDALSTQFQPVNAPAHHETKPITTSSSAPTAPTQSVSAPAAPPAHPTTAQPTPYPQQPNLPYAAPYGNPYQQFYYPPPPLPQQQYGQYPANYYVPGQYPQNAYPQYPPNQAPPPSSQSGQGYPSYPNPPFSQPPK